MIKFTRDDSYEISSWKQSSFFPEGILLKIFLSLMSKHKDQGSTKLFRVDHFVDGIFVVVQKDSNVKKES